MTWEIDPATVTFMIGAGIWAVTLILVIITHLIEPPK